MADGAEEIAKLGIDMFNVHASSGEKAMKEVMKRISQFEKRPLVLAVTALTSFSNDEFKKFMVIQLIKKPKNLQKWLLKLGLTGWYAPHLRVK